MVWYKEWESMRLYAIVCDSNVMVWELNGMLCYGVCCKRYTWPNCNVDKSTFIGLKLLNSIIFGQKYFSTSWKGKTYKKAQRDSTSWLTDS